MARSVLFAVAFYVTTALFLILGSWLLLAPRSWAMVGLKLHGRASVWLLRVICRTQMVVRGHEHLPAGACLVAAKHQSAWDTFALLPLFDDPAVVLKDELKYIPLYGWFCLKFEHILLRRDKGPSALKAMLRAARSRAAEGRQILIFPEGTRTVPGAAVDYKPGVVALYEGLRLPCVPIALNSGIYWPRRTLMRYPGKIIVEILPPLPAGLPRAEFRKRLVDDIEHASQRLMDEAHDRDDVRNPVQTYT